MTRIEPPAGSVGHPAYRADIYGLRAIAVLAVVIFHAFPDWLGGGFVGVDIFFVISGFLITTIIVGLLDRVSFGLAGFYRRRILRIFPALIVVMVACLLVGWVVLLPGELAQLGTCGGRCGLRVQLCSPLVGSSSSAACNPSIAS